MIKENLIAERFAIDSYRYTLISMWNQDPNTLRLLKSILAAEDEHADDLADLLQQVP